MTPLKKVYKFYCSVQEVFVAVAITLVTALVFGGAVMRYAGHPINWAQDLAMLLMAWVVFLGADIALRSVGFISVDVLYARFPKVVQNVLFGIFLAASLVFLGVLVFYGIQLAMSNTSRIYQTLGISYFWATLSAPVGALMLGVTLCIQAVEKLQGKKIPGFGGSEAVDVV
jgi:TRAP-type C4-dicarboxylate transport system permease small subunit